MVHPSLNECRRWPAASAVRKERSLVDGRPPLKKQEHLSPPPPSPPTLPPPPATTIAPSSSSLSPSRSSMWDQPLKPPLQNQQQQEQEQQQEERQLQPPSPGAATTEPDAAAATDQWCARNSAALLEACCNHDLAKAKKILEQPQSSVEQCRSQSSVQQSQTQSSVEQVCQVEQSAAVATATEVVVNPPTGRMQQLVLARDDFQDSALHLASGNGEVDIVRLLLARGADVEAENNLGSTPLNRAAVAGRAEVSVRSWPWCWAACWVGGLTKNASTTTTAAACLRIN